MRQSHPRIVSFRVLPILAIALAVWFLTNLEHQSVQRILSPNQYYDTFQPIRKNPLVIVRPLEAQEQESEGPLLIAPSQLETDERRPSEHGRIQSQDHVEWLKVGELDINDFFSATWIMSRTTFLESNVTYIKNVEGACFGLFRDREDKLRMSLDWLDFSVEHLSKWWRLLNVPSSESANEVVFTTLLQYVEKVLKRQGQPPKLKPLHPTIAMIAFQQYKSDQFPDRGRELTVVSLLATVASLIGAGLGRIVVVGLEADDELIAYRALDIARNVSGAFSQPASAELAYVRVSEEMASSAYDPVNLPRAAVVGLTQALRGTDPSWTKAWLGEDPDRWKYIYLTEPDSILQTRDSALLQLKQALDDDLIVTPHRLQPIPYEGDVPYETNDHSVVLKDQKIPRWMDDNVDACCDEQAGDYKPGAPPYMEHCGDFWWTCGFSMDPGNHSRLEPYDFMRLASGTAITSLVGSEQGRRCLPSKRGECRLKLPVPAGTTS